MTAVRKTTEGLSARLAAAEAEAAKLRRENEALRQRDAELVQYLRQKVDQLLQVIGTLPLRSDELDDAGLIAFDPIGIVADSFAQILQAQRQANIDLKLARDKIDAIYNAVGAAIVVLDRDRHILSHNRRLKENFFPGTRKVVGHTCVSLMCRSDAPLAGCVFDKVLASGQRERTPEWPFGGNFYDVVGMPVKDRRGTVQQVVIVYHEVTERKRAEQELSAALEEAHQSREHIEAIVRSINDGMLVTDCSGTIQVANPAALGLLGVRGGEFVGRMIDETDAGTDLPRRVALACASDNPGSAFDFDPAGGEETERPRMLQARLALLHRSGGAVRGCVVMLRDVTRERELEKMKSEFVSTAAHELRTPLASILGFSELLLDAEAFSAEERSEFVSLIHRKAEDLSTLIDELLDISRIEDGRDIPLVLEAVHLGPLAAASVEFFRRSCLQHEFRLVVPPEPVTVLADPRRVTQIFENLLSNAVKYSPAGGAVTIRLRPEGKRCMVYVSDAGIGMTDEQVQRVFDKFYRADASNTAVQGTGLGMTIVKKIVAGHGGEITVESAPGEGTTVCFSLKLFPSRRPEPH